ncbi:MAG: RNA-binding protein [Eubacterium sp.]|nr:RNA-binding protein [Eubacterium sp.]
MTSETTQYLSDHIGTRRTLKIARMTEHGAYLVDDTAQVDDEVLLPRGELTDELGVGSQVDVFLYKDSEDRLTATLEQPALLLGEVARLKVAAVTNIGAFLEWGLKKDLFLPFKEQTKRVKPGDEIPVALYLDKSERLCATMHLYDFLKTPAPYQVQDHIQGQIYEILDSFGAFVIIDNSYSGLIPHNEMNRELHVGDMLSARIKEITSDGKLTLSLQEKKKVQMRDDAARIYERLVSSGGFLPFHDKTSPEIIKREFQTSKAAFKRALGRLKKENRITIHEDGIRLVKSDNNQSTSISK